jgi:hypothetical protein
MKHVFVSYARKDLQLVDQVVNVLKSVGFILWVDRTDIPGGELWQNEIREAIDNCYVFLIFISPQSMNSRYVIQEYYQAIEKEKFILPVLIEQSHIPDEISSLGDRQIIELVSDWNEGLQDLQNRLKGVHDPNLRITDRNRVFEILIHRIKDQSCIPILGPGIYKDTVPTIYEEIAQELANEPECRSNNQSDLGQVIKSLEISWGRRGVEHEFVSRINKDVETKPLNKIDPHVLLAQLPFDIFVTTNYDDSMLKALEYCGEKNVARVVLPWKDDGKKETPFYDIRNIRDKKIVVHLFGHIMEPKSMLLTDDDFEESLRETSWDKDLVPIWLKAEIANSTLLFIGFRPDDRSFKTLLRLVNIESNSLFRMMSIAQFLFADITNQTISELRNKYRTEVVDGTVSEFIGEIKEKWEEWEGIIANDDG